MLLLLRMLLLLLKDKDEDEKACTCNWYWSFRHTLERTIARIATSKGEERRGVVVEESDQVPDSRINAMQCCSDADGSYTAVRLVRENTVEEIIQHVQAKSH
jgi:hypothetical protein